MSKKLKRIVIKEELIELTGDITKAILLNQFIYWSERMKDFDRFLEEEKKRMKIKEEKPNIEKQNGWIYKSAEELSEETMLNMTSKTIRKHLKDLIESGWLDERNNPKYNWDRTKQYRVNITKVQRDLQELGYLLEGYPIQIEVEDIHDDPQMPDASGKEEKCKGKEVKVQGEESKNGEGKKEKSKWQKGKIEGEETKSRTSKKSNAIPEITTEITTETTTDKIELQKICNDDGPDKYEFKFTEESVEIQLSRFMIDEMLNIKPDSIVPGKDINSLQNWSQHIDYMVRIDKRTPRDIAELFRWAQGNSFWCSNIRSPRKLREKWDTLELQRNRGKPNNNNNISKLEEMYQREKAKEEERLGRT